MVRREVDEKVMPVITATVMDALAKRDGSSLVIRFNATRDMQENMFGDFVVVEFWTEKPAPAVRPEPPRNLCSNSPSSAKTL